MSSRRTRRRAWSWRSTRAASGTTGGCWPRSSPLPALGARLALEGPFDLLRDPAAVVGAGLWGDELVVEVGGVDAPRVEGQVVPQVLKAHLGLSVVPGDAVGALATGLRVDVGGGPLPLALGVDV